MTVIIRTPDIGPPEQHEEIAEPAGMSNLDHTIAAGLEQRLRTEDVWTHYAGWDFNGRVWFDRELQGFACQVWHYGQPVATVRARTLEDIMSEVSFVWGQA